MNINLIKQFLVDQNRALVLTDMWGPVTLNAGKALASESIIIDDMDELQIAAAIAERGSVFSFYKFDTNKEGKNVIRGYIGNDFVPTLAVRNSVTA